MTAPHARTARGQRRAGRPHRVVYRVKAGDNLWDIAARHLGDGERWHEIFTLNRGRPQPGGGALTDPSLIYPGWVLLLPAPRSRAWSPGRARSTRQPPRTDPAPAGAGDRPPRPGPPSPGGHGHHSARHARHPARPPLPATPGRERPVGIHLPGGGLAGITLAAAISTALVAWRLHRRRTAALRWPSGQRTRRDAVPEAVSGLRRAYLRSTGRRRRRGPR